MIIEVTNSNYATEVESYQGPMVLDLYASWCGPCIQMMPHFEELAKELSNKYKFVKLNVDEARDIAIKHNISSVPTLIFFKNGSLVAKESGYMNKDKLKQKLESILG